MADTVEQKDGQRSSQRSPSSDSSTSDESERSVSPQNRNYSDTNRRDEERSRNGRYNNRSEDIRYDDERSGNSRSRDTRYEEHERSPREREYSENSRYDEGRPGNRRYNDRSGETRYDDFEHSLSSRNRDYSEDSRSNHERSENRCYNDRFRDRSREKDQEKSKKENVRGKDFDRRKNSHSPSPVRRGEERSAKRGSATMNEPSIRTQENLATESEPTAKKKKDALDPILTRTGGAYIPPAKLRMMQEQITDKSSLAYQRMSWEALKKSINGLINKVNVSNIGNIIQELLQENIVRGRGQLSRSVLQAQSASPIFTHVYSAVVAIINSKFPQIGELILKRLILNFRKGYRRNDKVLCLTASKFVAHLINQNVAHEVLALEMLTLLLERPTDDSVEVSIGFLKESGLKLTQVSPRGVNAIFERLRNILHESEIDKRVQYMIEVMFAVRKDGFKDHPIIPEGLDLVEEDDQFTHMLPLEDDYNPEDVLNVFKMDPQFLENEEKYKTIKKEILDEGDSDSNDDDDGEAGSSDEDSDEEGVAENDEGQKVTIYDKTEINLVAFRRTIYLAIQSSLDFEECAHKLIKMEFPDSQTKELCNMILDCCAQQRTYEKFFGLLAGRFCMLKKEYMEAFEDIFKEQYETIHRLETNKLRNVAKMFAHLLYTDSIPWSVLECIILSEETTTSSSRIFVKIFFQELCEYMGLPRLNARLKDETLQPFFEGLLPRDSPRNTRFAINFFTSIGLGGLTDELREHLKNAPKVIMTQKQDVESSDSSSSSSSSDSDDSDESSSSLSKGDSSTSSDSDASRGKRKAQKKKKSKPPNKETNKKRTTDYENERQQERATEMESERHHKRVTEMENERHHKRATEMESERHHKRATEMENERHHKRATEMESERHHKRATEMERERHHKRATEMETERYRERTIERETERTQKRASEKENERTHKRASEKENERQRSKDDKRATKSDGHSHYSLHYQNSHRSPLLSH